MYFTLFDNHSESIQFTIYIVCPKCRLKVRIFQWTFVLPFQKKWRVIFLGFLLFGIENHEISPKFEHRPCSLPSCRVLESGIHGGRHSTNLESGTITHCDCPRHGREVPCGELIVRGWHGVLSLSDHVLELSVQLSQIHIHIFPSHKLSSHHSSTRTFSPRCTPYHDNIRERHHR
jgi:hypothetical protein